MPEAIEAMRRAFIQLSSGQAQVPQRLRVSIPNVDGNTLFMPVYLPESGFLGLKVVTLYKNNPDRGMPMTDALVTVFDADNGRPLAVMDGEHLTAIRTGAAAGLATELLSRPESSVAAVIGAGPQGRTQLEAIAAVRPIRKALIFDIVPERAVAFAAEMGKKLDLEVVPIKCIEGIRDADVISSVTPAREPVFREGDISPGTHINAVGGYTPEMIEIPPKTVARSALFVDQREACLREPGDILRPIQLGLIGEKHIRGEIGEVAAGLIQGRENPRSITLFKSVGNAVQDLAAAALVLWRAQERNLGLLLER